MRARRMPAFRWWRDRSPSGLAIRPKLPVSCQTVGVADLLSRCRLISLPRVSSRKSGRLRHDGQSAINGKASVRAALKDGVGDNLPTQDVPALPMRFEGKMGPREFTSPTGSSLRKKSHLLPEAHFFGSILRHRLPAAPPGRCTSRLPVYPAHPPPTPAPLPKGASPRRDALQSKWSGRSCDRPIAECPGGSAKVVPM